MRTTSRSWCAGGGARSETLALSSNRLDHIPLQYPVHDLHPFDDFGEDGVVAVEAKVVLQVDEPLRVASVVAAGAHAHGTADVRDGAQLVAQILPETDVLV